MSEQFNSLISMFTRHCQYCREQAVRQDTAGRLLIAKEWVVRAEVWDLARRCVEETARNYVVFDDEAIEILRKHGFLLPVAGATVTKQQPDQR